MTVGSFCAKAATRAWTGGGEPSYSWTNAANWGGTLPDFDDGDSAGG